MVEEHPATVTPAPLRCPHTRFGCTGDGVAVLPIHHDIVAFRLRVRARLTDNSRLASDVPAATLLTAPAFSTPCAYNNGLLFLVSL
jgi:hypothetical protein